MNGLTSSSCAATFAVTVTYGDRYRLPQQVVLGALMNGVGKIIVVDNGSADSSKMGLRKVELDSDGRVVVVPLPANLGSAVGFKAGLPEIESTRKSQCHPYDQ